jgi:hypothetical protein
MSLHVWNDSLKVKLDNADRYGFGDTKKGYETGIVVELPEKLLWFGMHSFMFEKSFMAHDDLEDLLDEYKKLLGKRIVWEALQDRGRVYKEGDDLYCNLKMADVLGYTDETDVIIEFVAQPGFTGGSFDPGA